MALLTPQPVTSVLTPSFAAPTVSDTIRWQPGLLLYVKIGATSTTVTVVVPGTQEYTGADVDDLAAAGISNTERVFAIPKLARDPATGLVTVTYSQIANVTHALLLARD
jgi:hypothetical protein